MRYELSVYQMYVEHFIVLARALEVAYYAPTCFSQIYKKDGAARRQIWDTCAQFNNTSCVQMLTSQVKRSGRQVRSKSEMHSVIGFKPEDRSVGMQF